MQDLPLMSEAMFRKSLYEGFGFPVAQAMAAGVDVVEKVYGGTLESWVIIPRPHPNVERILPIGYTEEVQEFRSMVEGR